MRKILEVFIIAAMWVMFVALAFIHLTSGNIFWGCIMIWFVVVTGFATYNAVAEL